MCGWQLWWHGHLEVSYRTACMHKRSSKSIQMEVLVWTWVNRQSHYATNCLLLFSLVHLCACHIRPHRRLEWPSPHDCTSSIWDELVFIPVIKPPAVRKVESKKFFAYPPTINFLFTSHYPCSPNYPIYPPTPFILQWQNLYLFLTKIFKLYIIFKKCILILESKSDFILCILINNMFKYVYNKTKSKFNFFEHRNI
jgi:hypothetical protein